MESAAPRRAAWEDLLALGEDVRAEVLGGQLLTMPAPLPRHSRAQRSLGRVVGGPYDDDDGIGGPVAGGSSSRSTCASTPTRSCGRT